MFERFTKDAREVVLQACAEARRLGASAVGSEHLLIAVAERCGPASFPAALGPPAPLGHRALLAPPVTADAVRRHVAQNDADAAALDAIGICLFEVRRRLEEAFGPEAWEGIGRPRFTPDAKKVLELALREAVAIRSKRIDARHVLLALMRHDGRARQIVAELGADPHAIYVTARESVARLMRLTAP